MYEQHMRGFGKKKVWKPARLHRGPRPGQDNCDDRATVVVAPNGTIAQGRKIVSVSVSVSMAAASRRAVLPLRAPGRRNETHARSPRPNKPAAEPPFVRAVIRWKARGTVYV